MTFLGKKTINIHYLHGFLGLPSDWDKIGSALDIYSLKNNEVISNFKYNLYDFIAEDLKTDLNTLAHQIFKKIKAKSSSDQVNILVGYSLGGRVALHILKQEIDYFKYAIFLSTNPGFLEALDRKNRFVIDRSWSEKFRTQDWDSLMSEWNSQDVLKNGCSQISRIETDYSRVKLSSLLENCSLALQENFDKFILENDQRITWVYGEEDFKYKTISLNLKRRNSELDLIEIKNSGHRVIFDAPGDISNILIQKIKKG